MKRVAALWLAVLALILAAAAAQDAPAALDADIVAVGRVYTMDPNHPRAEAVAVADGRVVYVGDIGGAKRLRGASTRWIETSGAVLPGLTDAHGHLRNLGRFLSTVQLVGTRSREEVLALVRKAQGDTPPGRWIRGRGWDQNDWPVEVFPTWRDLEGTEANPVYLRRVDGHAAWVNSTALEIAGVTRDTPDPPGGRIVRDADGDPTGIFVDNATKLITAHIPPPDADELDRWMQIAVEHCNRLGLAGVHDAGVTRAVLESLLRLDAAGSLTLRVYGMLDSRDEALIEEFLESGPQVLAGGRLAVRAIKVYADGALGSRGAALLAPYSDDRDNTGLVVTPPDSIEYLCERALEAGFQVCTHAIGDRGNRVALDAYEKALRSHPTRDHRFRIEHCQVLDPQDIPRFATLGVVPSMQPTHATSDMYWAGKRLGAERLAGAYAWRWLIDEGNPLPLGSDFPVESANPMWGIYAAVTRQDADGWPEGGWFPAQCITVEEAVRGFTRDAAYARFAEDELGTLAPGMAGDVTVLDRDIFSVSPPSIRTARVVATIVAGRVVFENRTLR